MVAEVPDRLPFARQRPIFQALQLPSDVLKEFEQLASDNTSGATELIWKLLALCESCAIGYRFEELREGFELLQDAQKSMPSLHAVLHILKSEFLPTLREDEETVDAIAYLTSLEKILTQSGEQIAGIFGGLFARPVTVTTLSRSSTVLASLYHLHGLGRLTHVYLLEGRPMFEGHRSARDLHEHGIPTTLMVDAAMAEAVLHSDAVVVGADSISADGFLLNKTGTYPLAMCCMALQKPMYVLCDSLKFSPQLHSEIPVEDRPGEELLQRGAEDGYSIWNRYFEWTPVESVNAFITERGAFTPDQLSALAGESESSA
jgi:translation initiation factor 2B subunit (eIF-2B alpha/beta/delta family)